MSANTAVSRAEVEQKNVADESRKRLCVCVCETEREREKEREREREFLEVYAYGFVYIFLCACVCARVCVCVCVCVPLVRLMEQTVHREKLHNTSAKHILTIALYISATIPLSLSLSQFA